jgi:phosphoribosylglycinamide formyltransferase, formyltetrahydrofolate-dependent
VVLISGNGSNLQAIIDSMKRAELPIELRAVISNQAEAYGLKRARRAGIPTKILKHTVFPDRDAFCADLQRLIDRYQPALVALAGFMRILSADFVTHYPGRILNIHPSLLPAFRGLNTHARALAAGVQEHGASVHFVTEEVDGGPVILQARVPVLPDDDPQTLAVRVLQQEHRIYPLALRWFAQGRLAMMGDKVLFDGKVVHKPLVLQPDADAVTE